ncbi:hypothetical protein BDF22DRAFT_685137 [Syncephalis plumigaleata]|nr:hypothetical protein BDF22DRAFT_685137 [Syncephalis plumigaleata]
MHTLTRQEEEKLLEEFACDLDIKAFAACAAGVIFACRDLQKKMNACLKAYGESGELDKMKLARLQEKRR